MIAQGEGNATELEARLQSLLELQKEYKRFEETQTAETMESMRQKAEEAQVLYSASENEIASGKAYSDGLMGARRAFYRDLRKTIVDSDVLLEVVDARDPNNCRCLELEDSIVAAGKKIVIVLNKIDLVPSESVVGWLSYLRKRFPTVAFKCVTGSSGRVRFAQTDATSAAPGLLNNSTAVIGATDLINILKNYSRSSSSKLSKTSIRVGVIGYPNVGKSSLINSLTRSTKATSTGAEAGVTRSRQEVQLDKSVWLIDSPGVVFSGSVDDPDNVLKNGVKLTLVRDPKAVVAVLVQRCPQEALMKFFKVGLFEDEEEFLANVARTRGRLSKGGKPDTVAAARLVLTEWTTGKVPYYCAPPHETMDSEMKIVSSMSQGLDLDMLAKMDSAALSAVAGPSNMESMQMSDAGFGSMGPDPTGQSKEVALELRFGEKIVKGSSKQPSSKAILKKYQDQRAELMKDTVVGAAAKKLAKSPVAAPPALKQRAIDKKAQKQKRREALRNKKEQVNSMEDL
eukprot:Selendium_serpulae@DN5868_c0_g2_i1.p1